MITSLTLLILSLMVLYIGAGWLVQGSSALALKANISPLVIGLTIVAFGTSAPELAVSLGATLRGQGDIAIGNIVGSNIFNIGVILGVSATICPLQVKKQLLRIDIPIMLAATILFTILFWNGTLGRMEGLFFLTGIIIYTLFSLLYSRKQEEEPNLELEEQPKHWAVDTLTIIGGLVVLVFASRLLVDNAVSIAKELGVSEAVIGLTIVALGTSLPELVTSGYCHREHRRLKPIQHTGHSRFLFAYASHRGQKCKLHRPAGHAGYIHFVIAADEKRTKNIPDRRGRFDSHLCDLPVLVTSRHLLTAFMQK